MATLLTLGAAPELRLEPRVDFEVDEDFLARGGVQAFVGLEPWTVSPPAGAALTVFGALDDGPAPVHARHVVMGRVVYTVERDVSFFTEARARDLAWVRRLAPEMKVEAEPDGSFRVTRAPSNRFTLAWHDAPAPQRGSLKAFLSLLPAPPASVVVQKNFDFARVLGFRTAERSVTFTAHRALGPGRTRVEVYTLSLLVNLPPPFLGGTRRVVRESIDGTRELIGHLRSYDGP